MPRPNIVQFLQDPEGLGKHKAFRHGLGTFQRWVVFLKALYALPMTEEELELYRYHTNRTSPPTVPFMQSWVACGRRSGKSFMSSVVAVYEALTGDWAERCAGGELATIVIISTDRKQSATIMRYIVEMLKIVAPKMIVRKTQEIVELNNGVEILVRAASYASVRSPQYVLAILDEAAFLKDEAGHYSQPVQLLYEALWPAIFRESEDGPAGKIICISTPRGRSGMMFEEFESAWNEPGDLSLAWRGSTIEMHPGYVTQDEVDKALVKQPAFARSEWNAEWREDVSGIFDVERLELAMGIGVGLTRNPVLAPDPKKHYLCFVDASQGRGDSFCAAVGYRDRNTDQVVIAKTWEWMSPFNEPSVIVAKCAKAIREYRISYVYCDNMAIGWVAADFLRDGVIAEGIKHSKSDLYVEFAGLINDHRVAMPYDERSRQQFLQLECYKDRNGDPAVDHAQRKGQHDDLANVIAGLAVTLFNETTAAPPEPIVVMGGHVIPDDGNWAVTKGRTERERDAESTRVFKQGENFSVIIKQ
jgi:hypothetical protein